MMRERSGFTIWRKIPHLRISGAISYFSRRDHQFNQIVVPIRFSRETIRLQSRIRTLEQLAIISEKDKGYDIYQ
jgi:hypothetical protein